eukprot:10993727-Alexandrium_andersonii.AAC.1
MNTATAQCNAGAHEVARTSQKPTTKALAQGGSQCHCKVQYSAKVGSPISHVRVTARTSAPSGSNRQSTERSRDARIDIS